MDILNGLNEKQREAVEHDEGPLIILAGAGSGKTRALTHRIAYLIKEKGVKPYNILAITFTNKAANEMKIRVVNILGSMANDIWVSTFHSACVKILRRDIDKIGYDRSFVIFDSYDQKTLIKTCLKELNINEKNFPPAMVIEVIRRAKNDLIDNKKFSKYYANDFRMSKISQIYDLYQEKLKSNIALDFDDLIMKTIELFNEQPMILDYYRKRFKYVLVDEYQDTNTSQYVLISLIVREHKNLCVIGDDDQSIYGWRGANIRNILDFEKEFPGCKVIKLEQNYRSTQNILDAANNVIKNNGGRKSKKLWTKNPEGTKIISITCNDEGEEAYLIAQNIKKMALEEGRGFGSFAILYRINAQSRRIEEMFIKEGIPYRIIKGLRFYDRKEIKDVMAYLRVIQNPSDSVAIKRIINYPKRGIGKTTVDTCEKLSVEKGISIFNILSQSSDLDELKRAAVRLEEFYLLIDSFRAQKESLPASKMIEEVIEKTGILKEFKKEGTDEALTRIENIRELLSVAVELEREGEGETLEDFLSYTSLISDMDSVEDDIEQVLLMTMHSAKGLEFPVVFITGMEEGVFPGYRSIGSESELEEERRLCYVGITRAKEKLFVTNVSSRTLFGNTTYNRASRFLEEIPEKLLDRVSTVGNSSGNFLSNSSTNTAINPEYFTAEEEKDIMNFVEGEIVIHKKFGRGVITKAEKEQDDLKLEIKFETAGFKRLMARYAKLKKAN